MPEKGDIIIGDPANTFYPDTAGVSAGVNADTGAPHIGLHFAGNWGSAGHPRQEIIVVLPPGIAEMIATQMQRGLSA